MTTARTHRRVLATLISAPLLAAPLALPASAAQAARPVPRPAPPVLTVEPSWLFQVGGQVDKAAPVRQNIYDLTAFHRQVPVLLSWSARSRVGIDHYDLYRYNPLNGRDLTPVRLGTHRTTYAMTHTDVHGAIGPINPTLYPTFKLVATDRRGLTATAGQVRRSPVGYEQEDGTSWTDGTGANRTFHRPVVSRGWRSVAGDDFDGGKVLATAVGGARVSLPVTASHTQQLALEMSTGPRLGAVEVRIDGRRVGVVDTWARTARARVLVAQYRLDAGNHTVTLVNLGVRYRPTVQLDGVFVSD